MATHVTNSQLGSHRCSVIRAKLEKYM